MQVIKCRFGHFYDADQFDICPHCKQASSQGESTFEPVTINEQEVEDSGVFIDFLNTTESSSDDITIGRFQAKQTQPRTSNRSSDAQEHKKSTALLNGKTAFSFNHSKTSSKDKNSQEDETIGRFSTKQKPTNADGPTYRSIPQVTASSQHQADEKRIPPKGGTPATSHHASGYSQLSNFRVNHPPVVGWLVCVKGPHWGESFEIRAGDNTIGRYGDNSIPLQYDSDASEYNHAVIQYQSEKDLFYISPYSFCSLNGKQVCSTTRIKHGDFLQIGKCTMRFNRLCGSNFSWFDYPKEER